MLLLYYTPWPVVMVIMYRAVFTIGIAVTRAVPGNNAIVSANDISSDNSHTNDRNSRGQIARCVTGLGPSDTEDNTILGGVYFNESGIPDVGCDDMSSPIIRQQAAGLGNPGVINIIQCRTPFTTALEGIYTCTIMNSSMMEQSIRFGVYFSARSESLDLYIPSLHHLYLSTQLLQ